MSIIMASCINRRIEQGNYTIGTESLGEITTSWEHYESIYDLNKKNEYINEWKNYENPKTNEEVEIYGYDENGMLVLSMSELIHIDDDIHKLPITPSTAPRTPISDSFVEGTARYNLYENSLHIVGYVTDLKSYCFRAIYPIIHPAEYGLPSQWEVGYTGYTETKITITDVIDVGRNIPDDKNGYDCLIGKEIVVKQHGYWYYDDNGNMKKSGAYEIYSYVLNPDVLAVMDILINNISFSDYLTGTEVYELLSNTSLENTLLFDFYPAENQKGEDITSIELLKDYFIELDKEYGGIYQPWRKANEVKERISF